MSSSAPISTLTSEDNPKSLIKKYSSSLTQMMSSDIDELINTMRLEPIYLSRSGRSDIKPASEFGINLDPALLERMRLKSGVPYERLNDTSVKTVFPRFLIEPNEKFRNAMLSSGMIYGLESPLENNYYFDLCCDGKAIIRYQAGRGGRDVLPFSAKQIERVVDVGAALLFERDLDYAPLFAADRAKKMLHGVPSNKVGKELASGLKVLGQKSPASSMIEQLQLLYLGQDITQVRMPKENLSNYKAIKDVMLNAGAAYQSDKEGSFFQFPKDIDAGQSLQNIQNGKRPNVQQETQFFATPRHVALSAVEEFGFPDGIKNKVFLEPSAGDGALAKELRTRGAKVTCIENWKPNVNALKAIGFEPLEQDFMKVSPAETELFDGILMNPPFTKGADMQHVLHALGFLSPDGELVAIMSPSFQTQSTKGPTQFKELMALAEARVTPIEKGAFKESGTDVATLRVHVCMNKLLVALDARNETGQEYGLDLEKVWHAHQNSPKVSQKRAAASRP